MTRRSLGPWRGVAALLLCSPLVSCVEEPVPLYEARGVLYYANEDDTSVCSAAPEHVATYRDALLDAYPIEVEPGTIHYYKYRPYFDLRAHSPCTPGAECAVGFEVHSVQELHRHEVAHVTSETVFGQGGPLSEGYATALSCSDGGNRLDEDADVDFSYASGNIYEEYHVAGALVLELLRRRGTAALGRAHELFWDGASYPETSPGGNRRALADAVEQVYGASLDDVLDEIRRREVPSCLPVGRCAAAPLEEGVNLLESSCGQREFLLAPQLPSPVGLVGDGALQLLSCTADANLYPPRETSLATEQLGEDAGIRRRRVERVMLPPPQAHLLGFASGRDDRRASVTLRYRPGAYLDSCPAEDVSPLDYSVAWSSALSVPLEPGGYWFTYDFSGGDRLEVSDVLATWTSGSGGYVAAPEGLKAYLCLSCTEAPEEECEELKMSEQELPENYWPAPLDDVDAEVSDSDSASTTSPASDTPELFARFAAEPKAYIYLSVTSPPEESTYLEFAARFLLAP